MDRTHLAAGAVALGFAMSPAFGGITPTSGDAPAAPAAETIVLGSGGVHAIDVSGVLSSRNQGDALNTVFELDVPELAVVVGFGWDLTVEIDSPGVLSDAMIGLVDGAGDGVVGNPGEGVNFPGTLGFATMPQVVALGDDAFMPGDGLYLEFYQQFSGPEAEYLTESTVYVELVIIPAPAGSAVLAGAGLLAMRRRR